MQVAKVFFDMDTCEYSRAQHENLYNSNARAAHESLHRRSLQQISKSKSTKKMGKKSSGVYRNVRLRDFYVEGDSCDFETLEKERKMRKDYRAKCDGCICDALSLCCCFPCLYFCVLAQG